MPPPCRGEAQVNGFRIVQISDPHLSTFHWQHNHNWEILLEWLGRQAPDLVVVSGDVLYSDSDDESDMAFARSQLSRIPCPWVVIPGNHDIGDCPSHPSSPKHVTQGRLKRWLHTFGTDRFVSQVPGWTLLGLNAQTLFSGEFGQDQWDWLEKQLAGITDSRSLAIFCHRPLFLEQLDETTANDDALHPDIRNRLLTLLAPHNLALFASGHKHQYRAFGLNRTVHIWAPSVSCVNKHPSVASWGLRTVGLIEYILMPDGQLRHTLTGDNFLLRNENYLLEKQAKSK